MSKLSEDQIADYKETFLLFDKKGDNKIALSDVGRTLRSIGQNPLESDVKKICDEIDPTGQKRVAFEQFLPYITRPTKEPGNADDFIDGLRVFDKDGNGFMSAAELRHVLTSLGERLTDDEVDSLLVGVEIDKDGGINYEDFVKHITTYV
ncbi:myosin alkali light chain 6 [Capsaspora owczarzaki ATCC 30864]|uniref:Myosin alkali light chain 6 n=1 Tax=Capsaspora owczarzaki (strain ATCC 30864) TaxID=595528 RepID=A0A0D2VYY2_CAPO3|nr:myosin alkali light chain 6 [Capsaspora owczarzaki ATCC 30864]KJE96977.1 myosin alkali light chain 6 [Capsaspora owczarzaki ATCC 30864]|eukprot:XP_004343341.1 myosin alkali light chain 6 [Capsaspora owczarzaki ATCC 30864]